MQYFEIKSGLDIARLYMFFKAYINPKVNNNAISIVNFSGKGEYKKNQAIYDKLLSLSKKYNFNAEDYLKYLIIENKNTNQSYILNVNSLREYANSRLIRKQYEKIYGYFLKSVNNIVKECNEMHYSSVKDYIKYLVTENKMAEKVISGKISIYYLSGIHHIDKLISKMNEINQQTLKIVKERYEKYNTDLQSACMFMKSKKINVISFTDDELTKIQNV